ncbi:hypothetical protein AFERRID_22490 [Acidithiobacillus ferridurans]|jgi:hypothetical protein|uniref:Uncharacterized protein n=1 Tax=Acidithiobacillus ferridurans TaxID=1232575 RepID=A0A2Z6IJK5_ACIFI|nr:hypothetical protein AFERRID_22490 [Acidithiobacillus ferridurans]
MEMGFPYALVPIRRSACAVVAGLRIAVKGEQRDGRSSFVNMYQLVTMFVNANKASRSS